MTKDVSSNSTVKKKNKTSAILLTLILVLFSVFLFLKNSDDGINDIRILTESYPPLQYINEKGQIDGFATEVVLKIIDDLDISQKIELCIKT